jgi:DNA-binding PadR family transcriptional regulator
VTDLLILATLLVGSKHGYQLKREAGIIFGQETLHNNQVYPLLRRFMSSKWVVKKTVPGERGQTRLQYSLTPLGRKELVARLGAFTDKDARSSEAFRFRVATFGLLKPDVRCRILEARARFLGGRQQKLTDIRASFPLDHYAEEVVALSQADAKSELTWIGRMRRFEKPRNE